MAQLLAGAIRPAIAARLSDAQAGYNAVMQGLAVNAGLGLPPQIDFSSAKNFFQAYCDPELLEENTPFDFPLMLLYHITSVNQTANSAREKWSTFDGNVTFGIDVCHSWNMETVDAAIFENTADLVEATMIEVFNSHDATKPLVWTPPNVRWSGVLTHQKFPVMLAGKGLLMQQKFQLTFGARI